MVGHEGVDSGASISSMSFATAHRPIVLPISQLYGRTGVLRGVVLGLTANDGLFFLVTGGSMSCWLPDNCLARVIWASQLV